MVASTATVAPEGMAMPPALSGACGPRRTYMGVGEESAPGGQVGMSPVDVLAGMGLAERDPAQREQRRKGCENESAPMLGRRSSVHVVSGSSQGSAIQCRP